MASMEKLIESSLPFLANELSFRVEKVSPLDYYYTDGTACGSILKLAVVRPGSESNVYIYPSGSFWSSSTLTEEEHRILDGWLETVKSKKIDCSCSECGKSSVTEAK